MISYARQVSFQEPWPPSMNNKYFKPLYLVKSAKLADFSITDVK